MSPTKTYTVKDIIDNLAKNPTFAPILPYPPYKSPSDAHERPKVGLAVESMKRHMTDEGWQIFDGLRHNGYELAGYNITTKTPEHFPFTRPVNPISGKIEDICTPIPPSSHSVNLTNVDQIIGILNPSTVVVQDKREWDVPQSHREFRERRARFNNVEALAKRTDIFKVTILKDSHQRPLYHRQSADDIGCHAWIIYYHPAIVYFNANYTRPNNYVRTYHTLNSDLVPSFNTKLTERKGALLSGAISGAYPLRIRLVNELKALPETTYLPHPGYHMRGCATADFLNTLNSFRVAICTSSMYGYALRKIIEATACGCIVLTDLPSDEVLPEIDENLVRIHPSISSQEISGILKTLYSTYNVDRQLLFAHKAMRYYDYRTMTKKLVEDIERMRVNYSRTVSSSTFLCNE